jgi:CheY-like chemotaxis protein
MGSLLTRSWFSKSSAQAAPGSGSLVPIASPADSLKPRTPSRILVIDANALSRHVIATSLAIAGYQVEQAENANSARALAAKTPDLILQNAMMPGLDCWGLLASLRQVTRATVVGYAGIAPSTHKAGGQRHGFAGFLTKPFAPSHLIRSLPLYLWQKQSAGLVPAVAKPSTIVETLSSQATLDEENGRSGRVLIVEDNACQRQQAQEAFAAAGFQVEQARHGIEALERLGRSVPDLVVTDTLMTGCDGFELCLTIRNLPGLSTLPVVLTPSALCDPFDRQVALALGADDYISRREGLEPLLQAACGALARPRAVAALAAS